MATKFSKYKAPNGSFYEQNDIDYLVNNGYSLNSALDALSKSEKYLKPVANAGKKSLKPQKLSNAAAAVKNSKFSKYKAPNGNYYEQNDIDYLISQGYSEKSAIDALSKSDKYRKTVSNVSSGGSGGNSQRFSGSSGGRRNSGGGSSSGGGSKIGRAAKMAALAAGGGAAALAAKEAYEQYLETGEIEILDAFIVEWEEEIDWDEVDWDEVELDEFEEIQDLEDEIEETEAEMELDAAEMELDATEMEMEIEATEAEMEMDEAEMEMDAAEAEMETEGGYDEGGDYDCGGDEGGYDEGGDYDCGGGDEGGYDDSGDYDG